jgi:hypothetical protein
VHQRNKRIDLNWDPHYSEGEDDSSMKWRHKQFLKAEWKKRAKDEGEIAQRMLLTFPDRIRMVNERKSIKEIRENTQHCLASHKKDMVNLRSSMFCTALL